MSRKARRRGGLPFKNFGAVPKDGAKKASGILTAPEYRVWICLCIQSQLWNNGTANLTRSVMREFHLGSTRTVTQAIRKMKVAGLIVQTRKARQHVCAMYGVTHLPPNADAMFKHGISGTRWEVLDFTRSATNSGTAAARPSGSIERDRIGPAATKFAGLARPPVNRTEEKTRSLARPQGMQSKNLPGHDGLETSFGGYES